MSRDPLDQLQDSLGELAFGIQERAAGAQQTTDELASSDQIQMYQYEIHGRATRQPVLLDQKVTFSNPFLMRVGPRQIDGNVEWPHFAYGVEMDTGDYHVQVSCQVREWIQDDSSFVTDAKVRIAVYSPEAAKEIPFTGVVHLTFSGFAAPMFND